MVSADKVRESAERLHGAEGVEDIGLVPVFTLVLWVFCMVVGLSGLLYSRWRAAVPTTQASIPVSILAVELKEDVLQMADTESDETEQMPGVVPAMLLPPAPAVAVASPAIAFALPVEGLVRLVDVKRAAPMKPLSAVGPANVQRLTLGEGEGKQPNPEYPREAALASQEGTIIVRFTVGADGRVTKAEAVVPCRWPLLNQAALRKVREAWRFPPGAVRSYEISIEFQLKHD
jgi:TonB family protein